MVSEFFAVTNRLHSAYIGAVRAIDGCPALTEVERGYHVLELSKVVEHDLGRIHAVRARNMDLCMADVNRISEEAHTRMDCYVKSVIL